MIETRVGKALGMPLSIGRIEAQASGLFPTLTLHDVVVSDAAAQPALRLGRVVAALSPASIWHAGFQQLYISEPHLELRRLADGGFAIGSLRFAGSVPAAGSDARAADWLFSQPEIVLENGTVHFVDEAVSGSVLRIEQVRLVLRNRGRSHELRLDAAPPARWGQPVTLVAQLREPLLSLHPGRWRDWSGELHASLPLLDAAALHADLRESSGTMNGRGALRLWVQLRRGHIAQASADVALADVRATLAPGLAPLGLQSLEARLDWRRAEEGDGFDFSARHLRAVMDNSAVWPGSELRWTQREADAQRPRRQARLQADRIDLGLLGRLAPQLPLDAAAREQVARLAPKGSIESLDASWEGTEVPPQHWSVKGRARDLEFSARAAPHAKEPGLPGLRGANVQFELDQSGGELSLAIENGSMSFPGIFEDPLIAVNRLSTTVRWRRHANDHWQVQLPDLKFANPDAAGEASLIWRTSDPAQSKSRSRFPGVLDLNGRLARANTARMHRYLPLDLPQDVRRYVAQAVGAGSASQVQFKVQGDIRELPFTDPRHGEFRIAANVRDLNFAYLPRAMQLAGEPPWPPLTQLSGELVFDRAALRFSNARGLLGSAPGLPLQGASATIANLDRPVVIASARLRAPLAEILKAVRTSPLEALTGSVLTRTTASGEAELTMKLTLPVLKPEKTVVEGSVALAGNDLRITPDSPLLERASGTVSFSESGFRLSEASARLYGGVARIEGGSGGPPPEGDDDGASLLASFSAQGTIGAEGLRGAAGELGVLGALARHFSGETRYDAALRVRRQGPELVVTSDLQGLALALPAPLAKPAADTLALRFESAAQPVAAGATAQDRWRLSLGRVVSAHYLRDVSREPAPALRGSLTLGLPASSAPPLPAAGVAARIELARLDVDAWQSILDGLDADDAAARPQPPRKATAMAAAPAASVWRSYWPTQWQAQIARLDTAGYQLSQVTSQGTREAALWRAVVDSDQLSGQIEFRESAGSGAGQLNARLKRLVLPDPAPAVRTLAPRRKPLERLPALDVVAEQFELRGLKLGRLEIDAVNRTLGASSAREWRLNKLQLSMPEARLSGNGSWSADSSQDDEALRTLLDFGLDVADSGALLARLGMKGVLRRGRGALQGRLSWSGSPLSLDYPSLEGQFHVNVEAGQFLKAEPGLAKLLGVLSLQALPRRLSLDFRDLFSEGFAFDFIRGDVQVEQGVAFTNNLQMKGANAAVLMEGSADIARETQDLKVVVVPEVDAGTAALVAGVINPAIGLGTFLAQYFLSKPLSQAATQQFHIEGTWSDPRISKVPRRAPSERNPPAASAASTRPGVVQ